LKAAQTNAFPIDKALFGQKKNKLKKWIILGRRKTVADPLRICILDANV